VIAGGRQQKTLPAIAWQDYFAPMGLSDHRGRQQKTLPAIAGFDFFFSMLCKASFASLSKKKPDTTCRVFC